MAVKYMMCSLPILRSSRKQVAVVLVLGVVPQFTRQGKANRMTFMVSSMNQNSSYRRKFGSRERNLVRVSGEFELDWLKSRINSKRNGTWFELSNFELNRGPNVDSKPVCKCFLSCFRWLSGYHEFHQLFISAVSVCRHSTFSKNFIFHLNLHSS